MNNRSNIFNNQKIIITIKQLLLDNIYYRIFENKFVFLAWDIDSNIIIKQLSNQYKVFNNNKIKLNIFLKKNIEIL